MFNTVNESLIKQIPDVYGVDNERLPQSLSRVYARIICLKTKYEAGRLPFNNAELNDDYRELENLSNMLELYLMDNAKHDNRKAIAYVAATGRKQMGMIRNRQKEPLTLQFIPEEVYAALLYVISGSLADAQEVASRFVVDDDTKEWNGQIMLCLKWLLEGDLHKIESRKEIILNREAPLELAEELLWRECVRGIKHLAAFLLHGTNYENEEFNRVEELSCYDFKIGGESRTKIYSGALLLSKLLAMTAMVLKEHALIGIEVPKGIWDRDWQDTKLQMVKSRPYLWDNHIDAINKGILNVGTSAVITFPTGAGKTTLSELKIAACLLTGKDIIYLVPTHALEHQVYKSMDKLVKRLNCPVAQNRDGEFALLEEDGEDIPIKVMTPEHCLTVMTVNSAQFEDVGLVVFDEFHMMSGEEWDGRAVDSMLLMTELLTHLPSADYLLISAMVSNGNEVAEWIAGATGKECLLFDNPWKPTSQLQGCVVYNSTRLAELVQDIKSTKRSISKKTPPKELQDRMVIQPECLFCLKAVWDTLDINDYYHGDILDYSIRLSVGHNQNNGNWYLSANYNEVAAEIAAKYASIGMKTIVFALGPRDANRINKTLQGLIEENHYDFFASNFRKQVDLIGLELGGFEYSYLADCISSTLHHSNLIPEERVVSEDYFTSKDGVPVMVATPTIAQGINLPADVVLIAGSSRFDKRKQMREQIDAHEILNAAGRAGRAGFRSHGTAILIASKPIGMENTNIYKIWGDIKDEIFSKGDRCLDVKDPLGDVLNKVEEGVRPLFLFKIQGEDDDIKEKIGKSLYAYKMQRDNRKTEYERQVERLISVVNENKSDNSMLATLAIKTRTDENTVRRLLEDIEDRQDTPDTVNMNTKDLLKWVSYLLCSNSDLFEVLLGNDYASERGKKVLGMKESQAWDAISIKRLFDLAVTYVSGATYLDIEKGLGKNPDNRLTKAREFVLKVIPAISYACGTVIQILMAWYEAHGFDMDELPRDFKVFSLCVKEGVTDYEMLLTKYKKKLMRVECHQMLHR